MEIEEIPSGGPAPSLKESHSAVNKRLQLFTCGRGAKALVPFPPQGHIYFAQTAG